MKNEHEPWLSRLLRDGDPGEDGRDPEPHEIVRIRSAVLAEAERPPRRWLLPVLVPATGLALALGLALYLQQAHREPVSTDTPAQAAPERQKRQIQFTTESGVRIIWILDPRLEL